MNGERYFVTGGTGCIGAWVVRNLVSGGYFTAVLDHGGSRHRLSMLLAEDELSRVIFIAGNVANLAAVEKALNLTEATNLIHLAALQLPFCKANPSQGALVNVVGTINIFEACKKVGINKVVYASTTAVYGPKGAYPNRRLSSNVALYPGSHYGVYKRANEGNARVYWLDDGISSLGVRPYTVYGPGRDQGLTSSPTKAMIAAAIGRPYKIPFGGRYGFEFADDVAKIFIAAAQATYEGAYSFSIGGKSTSTSEIINAIARAEPTMRNKLSYDDKPLPFPEEFDDHEIVSLLGAIPRTKLEDGVSFTISAYRKEIADGRLNNKQLDALLSS